MERGVKEAALVGSTGRHEEQRSAYGIIRSVNVLLEDIDRETSVPKRINALLKGAQAAVDRKKALVDRLGIQDYNQAFLEVKNKIHSHHYKHERIQGILIEAAEAVNINKATNVRQQATGVTETIDNVMRKYELEKYSSVSKAAGFQNFLLHELKSRDYNDFLKPQATTATGRLKKREVKGFKDLMSALKQLEATRVAQEYPDDNQRAEASKKGFKKLCDQPFQGGLPVSVAIFAVSPIRMLYYCC